MKQKTSFLVSAALLAVFSNGAVRSAAEIKIPFELGKGQLLYEKYCSSCHGMQLDGSDKGPPLIHPLYRPSHHGDRAFYNAVLKGSRQHHWEFGAMPPVVGMTRKKVDSVVPYIRYYQQQKKMY